jgi:DNA-binding GntR family transcriptional regulator
MSSVDQPSMTETVYLETRFQILSGAYLPGSILDRDEFAEVYSCSPRLLLDVFNTLRNEAYIDIPKRGTYAVRSWDRIEVEDYYDLWANIAGVAAARAAERADHEDLVALQGNFSPIGDLDTGEPDCVERMLLEYVKFSVDLVRVSRAGPLMSISKTAIPNFLFRRVFWSSNHEELLADRESLDSVVSNLLDRSATFAKDTLREMIMRSLPAVCKDLEKHASAESKAVVARPALPLKRGAVMFNLGGREPGLDGEIVPYGFNRYY